MHGLLLPHGRALTLVFLVACASAGGSADPMSFSRSVGTATAYDIDRKSAMLLRRYDFLVARRETTPNLYIESQWKGRIPFDDERKKGVKEARDRVILRARPRQRNSGLAQLYTVQITIERMVRMAGGQGWIAQPITKQFIEYADHIASDLRSQLRAGLRVF